MQNHALLNTLNGIYPPVLINWIKREVSKKALFYKIKWRIEKKKMLCEVYSLTENTDIVMFDWFSNVHHEVKYWNIIIQNWQAYMELNKKNQYFNDVSKIQLFGQMIKAHKEI